MAKERGHSGAAAFAFGPRSRLAPKKSDLVTGKYDLEAPKGETTVAVKIIDMLGEEVLVTQAI